MNNNKIIDNFIKFVTKQKCIVPIDFIKKYYILTINNFVSFSDCLFWLNIERDNLIKTLKISYKEGIDYFEISKNEDNDLIILATLINTKVNNRRKYYKLTIDCFKKISMSSNSKIGKLTKKYYIEMERIVKDFSNQELLKLEKENQKLKRNLNPIHISKKKGIYVWHYNDELQYRIGSGQDLNRRIRQHNSSHADNVIIDYHLETNCYKDLENIILKLLDNKRYRHNKDFFDCDINIIKKTIIIVNKLLLKLRNNCNK